MVFYTMPMTAHIMVTVTLTCMFSHHFIDTDNEPGDSECQVMVGQWVGTEIFSDWSDELPQEYVPSSAHVAYDYTAYEEMWWDHVPVPANTKKSALIYSNKVYSAGRTLAVYAAQHNHAEAYLLDDTRVTAGVNASWVIDDIQVG